MVLMYPTSDGKPNNSVETTQRKRSRKQKLRVDVVRYPVTVRLLLVQHAVIDEHVSNLRTPVRTHTHTHMDVLTHAPQQRHKRGW